MPTIFRNLQKAGTPLKTKDGMNKIVGVYELLGHYKNSPYKEKIISIRGKKNDHDKKKYNIYQFGKNVTVEWNDYEAMKHMGIPVVTWGVDIPDGKRRVKGQLTDENLTQFMYYDIDSYENCTIEEIMEFLKTLPVVAGAWKSLSGSGGGFLVKFNGLTLENIKYNFSYYKERIEEMFLKYVGNFLAGSGASFTIDNLSDFTRVNVMSHDPDLYVNKECGVIWALNDPKKKKKNNIDFVSDNSIPFSIMEGHLNFIYENAISKDGSINTSENRIAYPFFTSYFGDANICGISLDNACKYLQDNHHDMLTDKYSIHNALEFGEKIYGNYDSDHCSFVNQVYIPNGYDLEDFNIPCKYDTKDIKVLLQKIYYDVKYYIKDSNSLKFAYNFAEECKVKGVFYRHVYDFMDRYKFTDVQIEAVQKIYTNPWKLFGANFVLKKGEDKKKINDYFKGKDYIIGSGDINLIRFENIEFDPDNISFRCHQRLYNFANNCLTEGIDFESLIKKANDCVSDEKIRGAFLVYCGEIYNKFSYRFGIKAKPTEIPIANVESTNIVPFGKYLSDINFSLPDHNSVIWADTGIGKTHFLLYSKDRLIILVPTTNLIESIALKYKGISVFYGQKKAPLKGNKIVCTYSSFPSLYYKMRKDKIKTKNYSLCFDESHNLCLSDQQFRGPELNFMISKMEEFKNVHCLTGTNIYNSHPAFRDFKVHRFRKEKVEIKNLYPVSYKNRIKSIFKNCDKNGLNVILLQNKDYSSKLGDYIKYFTDHGYNKNEIWTINSSEKTLAPYKYLTQNEAIPENIKLVITTSLFIEGANISNVNCKTMHFASFVSSYLMEQFANRFRKKVPEKIFYYLSKSKKQEDYKIENFNIKEVIDLQLKVLDYQINNVSVSDSETFMNRVLERTFSAISMHRGFLMEKDGKYEVDYISLNSMAVESERLNSIDNIGFLKYKLEDYGWKIHPTINDTEDLNKDEKYIMKEDRMQRKDATQKKITTLYKSFDGIPFDDLIEIYEKKKQNNSPNSDEIWEIDLLKKTLVLNQYVEFDDAKTIVLSWIQDGYSDSKFQTLLKKINLRYAIENYNYKIYANPEHPFSKAVYAYHKHVKHNFKDKLFTKKQFVRAFNFIRKQGEVNGYKMKKENHNIDEIKSILSHYVKVIEVIDDNGDKGYCLGGLNHINDMKVEFDKIMNYAKKIFDSGAKISKKEINTVFKNIRKNMPVLGEPESLKLLDEKKSFELMNLYCELNREGKSTYKIMKIGHSIFENVKWRIEDGELSPLTFSKINGQII